LLSFQENAEHWLIVSNLLERSFIFKFDWVHLDRR
jgi:hypothetical protein